MVEPSGTHLDRKCLAQLGLCDEGSRRRCDRARHRIHRMRAIRPYIIKPMPMYVLKSLRHVTSSNLHLP